jgi:hypothetical protein
MSQIPLAPNANNDSTQDSNITNRLANRPIPDGYRDVITQGALRRNELRNSFTASDIRLAYPAELGSEEQPHWLKILIRVREQNNQARQPGLTTDVAYTETTARRINAENNIAITGAVGAAAGATAAVKVAGKLLKNVRSIGVAGRAVAAVGAGAAGAGAGGAVGAALGAGLGENKLMTLKTSIRLGLQEPPKSEYTADWQEQAIGGVLSGGDVGAFNIAKGLAAEALRQNVNTGKIGQSLLNTTTEGALGAVDKALGKIRNPYREQIFKQVNFREFSFDYTFLPESLEEATQVIEILKVLRQNMLPEVAGNAFYLIYPAEFSLQYMYKENENPYVHQFSDCVLTGMSVKYGGQDFVTFRGTPGLPSEINMSLKFREIVPITGDRVVGENL